MMMSCLLRVKVHALWVQRSELLYPVVLSWFSSKLLMTSSLRTAILRSSKEWPGLLKWPATPVFDVIVMSVEADVEGVLCLPTYRLRHFLHSIK